MRRESRGEKGNKKAWQNLSGFLLGVGDDLLSHRDAVSSARQGLTSLFGMGRGAPPRNSRHVSVSGLEGEGKAACEEAVAMSRTRDRPPLHAAADGRAPHTGAPRKLSGN